MDRGAGRPVDSDARSTAAAVRRSLGDRGVSGDDVNSSRTKVHSVWEGHGPTRSLIGHQCRVEFAAEVKVLDAVEGCLVDLVAAGADEIVGVVYDGSRRAELLAAARREAVGAARAKAVLYAAVIVGFSIAGVVSG